MARTKQTGIRICGWKRPAAVPEHSASKESRHCASQHAHSSTSAKQVVDKSVQADQLQRDGMSAGPQPLPAVGDLKLMVEDLTLCQPPHNIPEELLSSCVDGDVLLVCKDKQAVRCHSQILSVASEVMRDVFQSCRTAPTSAAQVSNSPQLIPMMEDDALAWLRALQCVYPLVSPVPTLSAAHAADLALLGHKYSIKKVTQVAAVYLSRIAAVNPNVGYCTWIIPNANELLSPQWDQITHEFFAGGHKWKIGTRPDKRITDDEQCLAFYLKCISVRSHAPIAYFNIALVSGDNPSEDSVVRKSRSEVTFPVDVPPQGWPCFITCRRLGMRDDLWQGDTLEVQAFVHVVGQEGSAGEDSESATRPVYFSLDAADDLYVFKWLRLAQRIKDEELVGKCLKFINHNAAYVVFDPAFRDDLHAAMQSLSPAHLARMMYDKQGGINIREQHVDE